MAKADKEAKLARARARAQAGADRRRVDAGGAASPRPDAAGRAKSKWERRQTGLELLGGRGKLNAQQLAAGHRYGQLFRDASIESEAMIKSALGSIESGGGGAGGGALTKLLPAELLASARRELHDTRMNGLSLHSGLISACDCVCGRHMAPGEITPDRYEQLQVETSLRVALDLLNVHFGRSRHSEQNGG